MADDHAMGGDEYLHSQGAPQTPTWSTLLSHSHAQSLSGGNDVEPSHVLLPASSTTSLASLSSTSSSYPMSSLYPGSFDAAAGGGGYLPTPTPMSAFPNTVVPSHAQALQNAGAHMQAQMGLAPLGSAGGGQPVSEAHAYGHHPGGAGHAHGHGHAHSLSGGSSSHFGAQQKMGAVPLGALTPLQTQGLGPAGRHRSSSRALPYSRDNSISLKSEGGEDVGSILSSISNNSYTWSDMSGMSIEHRRAASTDFGGYRPRSLSRQASLGFLEADVVLRGTPAERGATVHDDLSQTAERIKTIVSTGQQDKARALWVKRWLRLSYSWHTGSTVPRQGLYHSYTATCSDHGLRPINSASFGKIVRSTFPGIKTRRLGVRGNSKYHYVAIRPSIPVEAEKLNAYGDSSGQLHVASAEDSEISEDEEDDLGALVERRDLPDPFAPRPSTFTGRSRSTSVDETKAARPIFARRHTTSAPTNITLPTPLTASGHVPPRPLPASAADVGYYPRLAQHRQALADAVWQLDFAQWEMQARAFWGAEDPHFYPASTVLDVYRSSFDHSLQLLLDKLHETVSPAAHQALVHFGLTVQQTMQHATQMLAAELGAAVVELAGEFGGLIVRFAQLHQITASLIPILANRTQLDAMLGAWARLDVAALIGQSAAVCGCSAPLLAGLFDAFYSWLCADGSVFGLCDWAERLLDHVFGQVGMSAVPRVTYVTSLVMRELTLCSDPSFGYFHLIKTWTDDYIAMTVQRRTAFAQPAPTWLGAPQSATLDGQALTPRPVF